MNVQIGTETPIFLFWEYLFRNFGILSLQCGRQAVICQLGKYMTVTACVWQPADGCMTASCATEDKMLGSYSWYGQLSGSRQAISCFWSSCSGVSCPIRARICKPLKEPRNRIPSLAESIPRNRLLGSLNVYKYGLSSPLAPPPKKNILTLF